MLENSIIDFSYWSLSRTRLNQNSGRHYANAIRNYKLCSVLFYDDPSFMKPKWTVAPNVYVKKFPWSLDHWTPIYLKYCFKFHVCLSFRYPLPIIRNVIPPAPKIFSFYNVILCRLPSEHFLVHIDLLFCKKLTLILTVCWKSAGNSNAAKIRGDSFKSNLIKSNGL